MESNNFALRLKRLFNEKRKADGTEYSQNERAHQILNKSSQLDPEAQDTILLMIEAMLKMKKSKRKGPRNRFAMLQTGREQVP